MNKNLELAKYHFELALSALSNNDALQAETELRSALQLSPSRPSILINLSTALLRQRKWFEAKKICSDLLKVESHSIEGLVNFGVCEHHLDNIDSALRYFNAALAINPNLSSAWVNKANVLLERGLFEEAQSCFEAALKLEPRSEESMIGLGNLHNELKQYELGLEYFSQALSENPNNFQAQWNKSLSLLRLGKYKDGWNLYESRWQIPGIAEHAKHQTITLWLGELPLSGKTILIYAEQGFGDTIQMARYLPILVNQLGAKVIFEVDPSLMELMKTLDPKIQIISSHKPLIEQIKVQPDFRCPVMSLPLAFKTTLDSILIQTPYLYSDQKKRPFWCKRLNEISLLEKPFQVGITWKGSGHYAGIKNFKRDIPFDEIRSLINDLSHHSFEFHAIQKELTKDYLSSAPKNLFFHQNLLNNFADSAALIAELDFVVSIDTATGHLSGAMGQKTLILLADPPDFMSLIDTKQSLWYPSITFLRQKQRDVWPISEIKEALLQASLISKI